MRSSHADFFNHDDDAAGYDRDVRIEDNPIRAGYEATLKWVTRAAEIGPESRVLELGSGTGNLTMRLPDCREIVCVDVSERMEERAKEKVARFTNRRFMREDILQVFDSPVGMFDVILSTYTVHHLTEEEKRRFFREVYGHLNDGGRAVFGDLMLETRAMRDVKIAGYRAKGDIETAEAIEQEFFWNVDEAMAVLEEIGFAVSVERFSELSFGILARKPPHCQ